VEQRPLLDNVLMFDKTTVEVTAHAYEQYCRVAYLCKTNDV